MLTKQEDFQHDVLEQRLSNYVAKGRRLSASFVNWFLENVYRLETTTADDALCDSQNDKGVDAIYVDHNFQEIHIIQSKLRADYNRTIGDVLPKELEGTRAQFSDMPSIEKLLDGGANEELKRLIVREDLAGLVENNYSVKGILISNCDPDHNAAEYVAINPAIEVWGRSKILEHIVDFDASEKIDDSFTFDVSFASPTRMATGGADVLVFPAKASELVRLGGISDTTLFSQNVRLSLGRTAVNKSIADSVRDPVEHKYFPLYHNGVIILCDKIVAADAEKVTISRYTVVNGAQSITTLYENQTKLSDDLRIFVRVVGLQDAELARRITKNSNNQNPTKPRDLKSGDPIMARLKAEFDAQGLPYFFEIKRGEKAPAGVAVISNDQAGRMLLAFDLGEPESTHQIYKVFEDKYADIFGRKEVNAHRIALLCEIMNLVEARMDRINNRPMASYALTKYFILHVVGEILWAGAWSKPLIQDPKRHYGTSEWSNLLTRVSEFLVSLMIDLNWEIAQFEKLNGTTYDYKSSLKSPKEITRLKTELLRSYEKEVEKGKAQSFNEG